MDLIGGMRAVVLETGVGVGAVAIVIVIERARLKQDLEGELACVPFPSAILYR
jgi:hypothetical protein